MIVIAAKNFMTRFWLFEMIDENVSARRARILLYISTISFACLFSMMTSSKRSSSPSCLEDWRQARVVAHAQQFVKHGAVRADGRIEVRQALLQLEEAQDLAVLHVVAQLVLDLLRELRDLAQIAQEVRRRLVEDLEQEARLLVGWKRRDVRSLNSVMTGVSSR